MAFLSRDAVVSRVRRALAKEGCNIKRSRSLNMQINVGEFYVYDVSRNFVVEGIDDVEAFARELGVLSDHEAMRNESDENIAA